MTNGAETLRKAALRVDQSSKFPLFLLTLTSHELAAVADVSRVSRGADGELQGYQRGVVGSHVRAIANYLSEDEVLLPNAIVLALRYEPRFIPSANGREAVGQAQTGILEIPVSAEGDPKVAWVVDGQQRTAALALSGRSTFPVPVTAFFAADEMTQREHFLRVNATKPLPRGLVAELLPGVPRPITRQLGNRQIAATLCDLLNRDAESPFYELVRRPSTPPGSRRKAVVSDTALIRMLEESLKSIGGGLFPFRDANDGDPDLLTMARVVTVFWQAVESAFPAAWGLPPSRSRLMHSVAIRALGRVMDQATREYGPPPGLKASIVTRRLRAMSDECRWTSGTWETLGLRWNEMQNVPSHFRALSTLMAQLWNESRD